MEFGIAEKERALVPPFVQSLATLQQSASAATDQLQTETDAAVEAMSESIASLVDDCERLLRLVGEGLASTITAQKDFAVRGFGLREARQRKANARESRSRLSASWRGAIDEAMGKAERAKLAGLERKCRGKLEALKRECNFALSRTVHSGAAQMLENTKDGSRPWRGRSH
jgi:hypothetical protein